MNQKWANHLGERSSIKVNRGHELEHATGDSAVVILASESEDKPLLLLLLLLPSKMSELKTKQNEL